MKMISINAKNNAKKDKRCKIENVLQIATIITMYKDNNAYHIVHQINMN